MSVILPNLICLGQPKCGTTTLYAVCKGHPDIYVSDFKEPGFFSNEKSFKNGLKWYSNKYFSNFNGEKVISEFTPYYLSSETALKNIYESLSPDTKFLIVLRNPAKRSFSHYLHLKRDGLVSEPFETIMDRLALTYSKDKVLDDKIGKIYTDSLYDVHLSNYFKYFPDRSKILILQFEEDLKKDCDGFKEKLSEFTGIEKGKFPSSVEAENSSQSVAAFIVPIKRMLNADNIIKKITRKIIPSHIMSKSKIRINSFLNRKFYKSSVGLDDETLQSINMKLFSNSIENTEKLLSGEFSSLEYSK